MNSSNTEPAADVSSQVLSEFFCPVKPTHVGVLSERTAFKITAGITLIICPVSILLNILVILAVKRRRELKEHNSNILLASLAVADVLMGAVSMPLTICLDVLILLKRFLSLDVFCRIGCANEMVIYIVSASSVYHLAVIAWERYLALTKWTKYKANATRDRIKHYASIAWLLAVLTTIPSRVIKLAGVQYNYVMALSIVSVLPGFVCILLISYFYIMVFLGVRKRNIETVSNVRSIIQAKLASKIARTTAILTAAVLISFVPSLILLFFGEAYPSLRRSSFFRWTIVMAQLNSLFNPLLYCYRDRRYRDAMLELLKMKKTTVRLRRNFRRIGSEQSVEDVAENNRIPRSRIRSCGSITNLRATDQQRNYELWKEGRNYGQVKRGRRMSAPLISEINRKVFADIHQPKIITERPEIQSSKQCNNQS